MSHKTIFPLQQMSQCIS